MIKKDFNSVKPSRASLFFRARASYSKILNVKSIFNTVKICRASASCSKILNDKIDIQYSENFQGPLCFSGQALVFQKSEM